MNLEIRLDPAREADIERRVIEHFSRLGYPDVAQAARWSLSLDGAAVRFRPLHAILEERLRTLGVEGSDRPTPSGPRLLISGMGSGSEMIAARRLGFGEIHGTEVDAFYVTLVADRLAGHAGFLPIPVDGVRIPYADGSFEFVVSGHIVEHTADPGAYVAEHLRVLKPGGFLLIEFPTRFHTRELHTGLPSLEWLPTRLRTGILESVGYCKGLGRMSFSDETRRLCRAITETGLKQVSLARVRRWAKASGVGTTLVSKGRPGPGVVYGLFRRSS
jgi:SAM-dependent methyltransferase